MWIKRNIQMFKLDFFDQVMTYFVNYDFMIITTFREWNLSSKWKGMEALLMLFLQYNWTI